MAENELRVNAYEAANRRFVGGRLHTGGQAYFEKLSDEPFDDTELFLSPGFIDMHVHLFDGYGIFGMHASLFGHRWGVHAMSDAGSCGFDNIDGFYKYIMPTYRGVTKPKLWIHVNGSDFRATTRASTFQRSGRSWRRARRENMPATSWE